MTARTRCGAVERTERGAFTCDRSAGHYPETDHAALGLGGRIVWLWADDETMTELAPRFWVLLPGGYSDTEADYSPAESRAAVHALVSDSRAWSAEPGAHVYAGERKPWTERDPYPDYVASIGPRGGARWENA